MSDGIVKVSQILVLAGIFFLVMAFLHILPSMFMHNKLCSEDNMRQAFAEYIPSGETLVAGIYATVQESKMTVVFRKCRGVEGKLIPDENGGVLSLDKGKFAEYEIYFGITQAHLLIVECRENKHYYQYTNEPDVQGMEVPELDAELDWADIGIRYPLEDVQGCELKDGRMGSIRCTLMLKNGTYFKMTLPDNAGPNADMPHHTEYRAAILARLTGTGI